MPDEIECLQIIFAGFVIGAGAVQFAFAASEIVAETAATAAAAAAAAATAAAAAAAAVETFVGIW